MPEIGFAIVAVLFIAVSQLLFKGAALRVGNAKHSLVQWPILLGLSMNGLAAILWVLALRRMELSQVFPLLSLNYLLVPLGARWFFRERLDQRKLLAIGVIAGGVLLAMSGG